MSRRAVGVTSIGSGVGQSVVRSLRLSGLPVSIVGIGNDSSAYAASECDRSVEVPGATDPGYIDAVIQACDSFGVGLLIPTIDVELPIVARSAALFRSAGVELLLAGEPLISACRDKAALAEHFPESASLFVRAFKLDEAIGALRTGTLDFPLIAKPRAGMASRGVLIVRSDADLDRVGDADVLQSLAVPHRDHPDREAYLEALAAGKNLQVAEISVQLVTGHDGRLLGRMATENRLLDGVPRRIVPIDQAAIWAGVEPLIPQLRALGLRGPVNVQGRLTDDGLRIFEMNPRFTGITGARALMGFNEVAACVRDFTGWFSPAPRLRPTKSRLAVRQVEDRVVPTAQLDDVSRPTLLVTGATGFLGRAFIAEALSWCDIVALVRERSVARTALPEAPSLRIVDHADLANGDVPFGSIDGLVHAAFARPHRSAAQIAQSLQATEQLLVESVRHQVPRIVNISSQSVYGTARTPPWTERDDAAPETPYAQAKYASELLLAGLASPARHIAVTSLRLAALAGCDGELLRRMSRTALDGERLEVLGGDHGFSRLDIRDAVSAITAVLHADPKKLRPVYNVDARDTHTLADLARAVADEVSRRTGLPPVDVSYLSGNIDERFGMATDALREDTGWEPQFDLSATIQGVVEAEALRQHDTSRSSYPR
jgi:nucleoside-diphosphate-sugar epimerase